MVSAIVPTYNSEKTIATCLKSIKNQSHKDIEIIVIDNFSKDQTVKIAKKFTPLVFQRGSERSSQRNFGLKKAQGEYVLFADADMELERSTLRECLEKMAADQNLAAIIIDEISKGPSFLARVKNLEKKIYRGQTEIEAARFFKKADLARIGGYDKNLVAGEDWDLTERIKKLGSLGKIRAKIYHHETQSLASDLKKKYYYAKHIKKYALKNPKAFQKQSSIWRFSILFKKPKIIAQNKREFLGLLLLKSAQYLAHILAKVSQKE